MSPSLMLPDPGVADLLAFWPDEPRGYEGEAGVLDRVITAESIGHCIDTGCVPADEIDVVSDGAALHPERHRAAGRTDPAKLRRLYVSRGIQRETGYSNYSHAFVTPPPAAQAVCLSLTRLHRLPWGSADDLPGVVHVHTRVAVLVTDPQRQSHSDFRL